MRSRDWRDTRLVGWGVEMGVVGAGAGGGGMSTIWTMGGLQHRCRHLGRMKGTDER